MTLEEMATIFEDSDDEFLKFDRITSHLRTARPDLEAFLRLEELVKGTDDIVSSAEHDEIFLSLDPKDLAEVVDREQLIDLIRCGLRYDDQCDSLAMIL